MGSNRTRLRGRVGALSAAVAAVLLSATPLTTMAADGEPDGVTGVDWILTGLVVDGTMTPVPEGVTPTLHLEDGQASGSTGCNSFSGSYALDEASLTFGALASTLAMCEGPLGSVEGPYLEALALVGGWSLTDGTLQLLDAAGEPLLEYGAQSASLEGTTWILARQDVDGALSPIPDGIVATLIMQDGSAGGAGGCNAWFGGYALDGDSLTFSGIGSTQMFCEGPGSEVEHEYLATLGHVRSWAITGSQLTLWAQDAPVLVYEAAPAASIVGSWVATSIAMGDAIVSSMSTSAVTADFGADGQLSGSDGCNTYNASYEVDGQSIAIGDLASTKMACPDDELNEQSVAYAAALADATSWSVEANGNLFLHSADGRVLVTFAPAGA